ncbi:MAG: hypothetical protein LBR74_10190 [Eubacterium sp.]|jgi:hypothetical protein|nr:hypothetical protein [Eubacterium sp.]
MNKKYISHSGNEVLISHFPGKSRIKHHDLMYEFSKRSFHIPDNIDIISVITQDILNDAVLHIQLSRNNIEYINPAKGRFFIWSMDKKIPLILQSLLLSKKEYCLILDGLDAVIISDLDNIFERFMTYGKKVLFNATIWKFPEILIDTVVNRDQYGKYNHFNAGCCFGKTKDLIDFYKYCNEVFENDLTVTDNEQYYLRRAFDKRQDDVFFDYDCRIFQVWHGVNERVEGSNVYLT